MHPNDELGQPDTPKPEHQVDKRPLKCLIVGLTLLTLNPPPTVSHQDKTRSAARLFYPTADHFIGVWKLNEGKSTTKGISELITIEAQGSDLKFSYDWSADNGTELHLWFLTDMKGGLTKPVQTNGKPLSKESGSRITRVDSNKFIDDAKLLRDEYTVAADGLTMTIQRTYKFDPAPHKLPAITVLVFDRQK